MMLIYIYLIYIFISSILFAHNCSMNLNNTLDHENHLFHLFHDYIFVTLRMKYVIFLIRIYFMYFICSNI